MHRLGFAWDKLDPLLQAIKRENLIRIASVFSHLSSAEDPDQDQFSQTQIGRFTKACEQIREITGYPFCRHILNSAGTERFPEASFEMVRLGIGLHGFSANRNTQLEPAATLKTVITQIHHLQPGETVGYGRKAKITQPTRIAVLPVGYADGIDRRLGNGNYSFMVGTRQASTVGEICMDMCMLDISGIEAEVGTEVVIFGPQKPVREMAEALHTHPYEILTSIHPRVKRIFLFE